MESEALNLADLLKPFLCLGAPFLVIPFFGVTFGWHRHDVYFHD